MPTWVYVLKLSGQVEVGDDVVVRVLPAAANDQAGAAKVLEIKTYFVDLKFGVYLEALFCFFGHKLCPLKPAIVQAALLRLI